MRCLSARETGTRLPSAAMNGSSLKSDTYLNARFLPGFSIKNQSALAALPLITLLYQTKAVLTYTATGKIDFKVYVSKLSRS